MSELSRSSGIRDCLLDLEGNFSDAHFYKSENFEKLFSFFTCFMLLLLIKDLLFQDDPFSSVLNPIFKSLNLSHNDLEDIPGPILYEHFPNLQSLDLSHNKISELKHIQSILLNKELIFLNLAVNPIKHLGKDEDTVLYSHSVSYLDISGCAIKSITNAESLMYMMNLTDLNLSNNPLVVIDHLVSNTLTHLDMSHCLLGLNDKAIRDQSFVRLPNLTFLDVSFNVHLTRFSLSNSLSTSLRQLDASYCALEIIDLKIFPNLQHAVLKGNSIKVLNNYMLSKNIYLQSLDISENLIHFIEPYAFSGAIYLQKLDLSKNMLLELNMASFSQIHQLQILNISGNLFASLNEIPIPSLISLDVSKCNIFELGPNLLIKAKHLEVLNLSHNSIEKLPTKFKASKLLNLDLSYCRLLDLQDETFQGLTSLNSLNLVGNRLTSPIQESIISHLHNMKDINLLNNPWQCDCNNTDYKAIWIYLSSHSKHNNQLTELICYSPNELKGVSWEKGCIKDILKIKAVKKPGLWLSSIVPFVTVCCFLAIVIIIRLSYTPQETELQNRELRNDRSSQNNGLSSRIAVRINDNDLTSDIQTVSNDSVQRLPVDELYKLPSYEEALLLPKLQGRNDLQNVIQKYEESGRFVISMSEDSQCLHLPNTFSQEHSISNPSTSGH